MLCTTSIPRQGIPRQGGRITENLNKNNWVKLSNFQKQCLWVWGKLSPRKYFQKSIPRWYSSRLLKISITIHSRHGFSDWSPHVVMAFISLIHILILIASPGKYGNKAKLVQKHISCCAQFQGGYSFKVGIVSRFQGAEIAPFSHPQSRYLVLAYNTHSISWKPL